MGKATREPSTRELATAAGIMQGKSIAEAMRAAGYSATYAHKFAGQVQARLRELDLLPTVQEARDILGLFRAVVVEEDDGAGLKQAFRSHLSRAQAGDAKAMRLIMEYLAGKPAQAVTVQGDPEHPVEHVVRFYLPDNGRGPKP